MAEQLAEFLVAGAVWFLLWFPLGWAGGLHLGAPVRRGRGCYEPVRALAARVEPPAPPPLQQVVIVPVGAPPTAGLPAWIPPVIEARGEHPR